MADYWKSQPRHFCDFCKCWTADNKPSREFHEKGKRHQESVQKKLETLRKKSFDDANKSKETSGYIVEMEKAALRKLREDLKKDPSLASQYGVTLKSAQSESVVVKKEADNPVVGEWIEGYSPEGYVYYWNTVTKESKWELPNELLSQSTVVVKVEGGGDDKGMKTCPTATTSARPLEEQTTSSAKAKEEEEDATNGRAQSQLKKKETKRLKEEKKSQKTETEVSVKIESIPLPGVPKVETCERKPRFQSAYGSWQTVQTDEELLVDYELPIDREDYDEEEVLPPPIIEPKAEYPAAPVTHEPKLKFAEKTVAGFGDGKVEGFKKRKMNNGAQRNIRGEKKLELVDDDDS